MPYCRVCGKEIDDRAEYCPHCGAPQRLRPARRPRDRGWQIARIFAAFLAGILLLTAFGLLMGGGAVMWAQRSFADPDGFLVSREVRLHTDSYALVSPSMDVNTDIELPSSMWITQETEIVTIKLVVESNHPSEDILVAIAQESQAESYLRDVEYDTLQKLDWSFEPWRGGEPNIEYSRHEGGPPPTAPVVLSSWSAVATGTGAQTLTWEPVSGRFWIVVMNADGSADVDVDIQLGARVPILRPIGNALVLGGLVVLIIGAYILLYWVR